MIVSCKTDMGRSREKNEDRYIYYKLNDYYDLLIVADGMGGHNAGEVASSMAVEYITDYIKGNIKNNQEIEELIKNSIIYANSNIYMESINNNSYYGMGTTVTIAVVSKYNMVIGHVGDSRAYIFKEGKIIKITNDHSLVAELVKNGTITEAEAQHHPQKNIITRALGTADSVVVDIERTDIKADNIIIMCTDGLSNMISDQELLKILLENNDLDITTKKMIDMANQLGGYDNITVILAKVTCPEDEVKK